MRCRSCTGRGTRLPTLVALVVVAGAVYVPYVASQQALLPDLVGEDERLLAKANALLLMGERTAALAGPALAGVLIAAVGAPAVLALDAASFLLSLALVATLVPRLAGRTRLGPPPRLLAGARFLARDRLLAPWTVSVGGFEAAWQMLVAALPVLAVVRYDGDPHVVGVALGGLGLGAVAGNVLAVRLLDRVPSVRLAVVAKVLQVAVLWVLVAELPRFGVAAVLVAAGLLSGLVTAPVTAIRTIRTPSPLRPAAGAAFLTVMLLLGAAGLAGSGPLLDDHGAHAAFLAAAVVQTAFTALFVAAALRRAPRPGEAPATVEPCPSASQP
ncbi:MAG: MFS transporter [Thermoleophilia bacterium]